jgi:hypothetical protein
VIDPRRVVIVRQDVVHVEQDQGYRSGHVLGCLLDADVDISGAGLIGPNRREPTRPWYVVIVMPFQAASCRSLIFTLALLAKLEAVPP